jgi:hypothetical protein
MEERRAMHREPFDLSVSIRSGRRGAGLRCRLVDFSIRGARVHAQDIAVPNAFTLLIGEASRRCSVVWRDGFTVGLKFI